MNYPKVTEVILRDRIKEQTCLVSHCAFLRLEDKLSVLPGIHLLTVSSVEAVCAYAHNMYTYIHICIVAIEVELLLCCLSLALYGSLITHTPYFGFILLKPTPVYGYFYDTLKYGGFSH